MAGLRVSAISRRSALAVGLLLVSLAGPLDAKAADGDERPSLDLEQAQETLEETRRLLREGLYSDGERLARELLSEMEDKFGADSERTAVVLDVLVSALLYLGKARDEETASLATRAVAIRENADAPEAADLVGSLRNLAFVHMSRGEYGAARPILERSLAVGEEAYGSAHPDVAKSMIDLSVTLWRAGDLAGAKPLAERALAIQEEVHGPEHLSLTDGLLNLATVLKRMGEYEQARPLYERCVALTEKNLGPDHPALARNLTGYANLLLSTGDYVAAGSILRRALGIQEKALGRHHPQVADTLNNLGVVLKELAEYEEATTFLGRALAIREQALGPEHPDVAGTLNNLALIHSERGDYLGARSKYERALAIYEKALGPVHFRVARGLNNLGLVLRNMGDYAAAKAAFERSLAIRQKTRGPDHPSVALVLNNMAILLQQMQEYERARDMFERALLVREKALGSAHPQLATTLSDLAVLLYDAELEPNPVVKPLLERALSVREKVLGPDHPRVATSLNNLAALLVDAGDFAQAEKLYLRSLAIREEVLGPDHPLTARSLDTLAGFFYRVGRYAKSLEYASRAEEKGRDHLRLTIRGLPEHQALHYAAVRSSSLDVALTIAGGEAAQTPGAVTGAWDAVVRSRALVLDEMAARHRTLASPDDTAGAQILDRLRMARQRLANLTVRGPGRLPTERYRGLLEAAQVEREEAERALAERHSGYRSEWERAHLGLAEVSSSLPAGSALLAYSRYHRYDIASAEPRKPVPSYLVFVLPSGAARPRAASLGPAEEIDALVSRWRQEMGREAKGTPRGAGGMESRHQNTGLALRHRIWDPIGPLLENTSRVFVVPDGVLHLVNLAALPMDGGTYLVEEGPVIHYLSAERDLVPISGARSNGAGLLALGGADFDETTLFAALAPRQEGKEALAGPSASPLPFRGERSSCARFKELRFTPLPETRREVREITSLWKKHRSHAGDGRVAVKLTQAEASETNFKAEATGKRILHLATHGYLLGGECTWVPDATRGIVGLDSRAEMDLPPAIGENPLLLSGLALAGANNREAAGPGEEDGILTAEEIAALDLSGVEWAVLSACDTGIGEIKAGEGVLGLRRAFQVAGARTLIMSLWPVEDESTREWMKALYEARLEKGLDTAESVREASLSVLHRRREAGQSTHPFYWAAFVAAGDWR